MIDKLLNKLPFWRRLDGAFLLRYPRLWQTRIHAAVLFALMVYPPVFLFGAVVVRALFMSMVGSMTSGGTTGTLLEINSMPDQLKFSYLFSQSFYNAITGAQLALFAFGALLCFVSILVWIQLMRSQRRYSADKVYGKRRSRNVWGEWFCYWLSGAFFAALPLVLFVGALPFPWQAAAAGRMNQNILDAAQELANAKSLSFKNYTTSDGSVKIVYLIDDAYTAPTFAGSTSSSRPPYRYLGFSNSTILVSFGFTATLHIVAAPATAITSSRDLSLWQIDMSDDPSLNSYISDLRDYTYASVFDLSPPQNRLLGAGGYAIYLYLIIFFWWLTGVVSLTLFMSKRDLGRISLLMMALVPLLMPIILFLFLLIVSIFLSNLIGPVGGIWAPAGMWNLIFGLPFLILFLISLVGVLQAAFRAKTHRRGLRLAVGSFPILFGVLPISILLNVITFLNSGGASSSINSDVRGLVLSQLNLAAWPALALIPFLFVPLLPLIDRAAVRLYSLPRET